jgi:hypothetical protein
MLSSEREKLTPNKIRKEMKFSLVKVAGANGSSPIYFGIICAADRGILFKINKLLV